LRTTARRCSSASRCHSANPPHEPAAPRASPPPTSDVPSSRKGRQRGSHSAEAFLDLGLAFPPFDLARDRLVHALLVDRIEVGAERLGEDEGDRMPRIDRKRPATWNRATRAKKAPNGR